MWCEACRCVLLARALRAHRKSPMCTAALPSSSRLPRLLSPSVCMPGSAGIAPLCAGINAGSAADARCLQLWSNAVQTRPGSPSGDLSSHRNGHVERALPWALGAEKSCEIGGMLFARMCSCGAGGLYHCILPVQEIVWCVFGCVRWMFADPP